MEEIDDEEYNDLQEFTLDLGNSQDNIHVLYATKEYSKELQAFASSSCDVCILDGEGIFKQQENVLHTGFIHVYEYAVKDSSRAKVLEAMMISYSALRSGGNQFVYSLPFMWLQPAFDLQVCKF